MPRLRLFFIFLFALLCNHTFATEEPTFEVSLLTCEPGPAIYEQYGHTAMRVKCKGDRTYKPFDLVFNYGCFDFSESFFALRFALGKTDYMLIGVPYEYFKKEYIEQHRRVWQQTLNITDTEARRIAEALIENAEPENRIYRYDFLYNNCTTKCRDLIEKYVDGEIQWKFDTSRATIRDLMHQYNHGFYWSRQSIDFCLGRSVDTIVSQRDKMFLPMNMMSAVSASSIIEGKQSGLINFRYRPIFKSRALLKSETLIVDPVEPYQPPQETDDSRDTESLIFLCLALCMFAKFTGNRMLNRIFYCLTFTLWAIVGIIGIVVSFLFFFSCHPSVDTNILVLAFNPIPLIALALWKRSNKLRFILIITMLVLTCTCVSICESKSLRLCCQVTPSLADLLMLLVFTSTLIIIIEDFAEPCIKWFFNLIANRLTSKENEQNK